MTSSGPGQARHLVPRLSHVLFRVCHHLSKADEWLFCLGRDGTHSLAFKNYWLFIRGPGISLASLIYWHCFAGQIVCNFFRSDGFYQYPLLSSLENIGNNEAMQNILETATGEICCLSYLLRFLCAFQDASPWFACESSWLLTRCCRRDTKQGESLLWNCQMVHVKKEFMPVVIAREK